MVKHDYLMTNVASLLVADALLFFVKIIASLRLENSYLHLYVILFFR